MKNAAAVLLALPIALAFPTMNAEELRRAMKRVPQCNDAQTARLFVNPPPLVDQSIKRIPDADHPYIAPGPTDQRGPCPALNTLANHGYINRTGIVTAEEMINGVAEGFSMEHDLGASIVAFNVMARGNPNTATLSIGFADDRVPPYPGCVDGPTAGGLAKHGRTEGDISITRKDATLGDHANFNEDMFLNLLSYVDLYGNDGPEGPATVVTPKVFQEFKYDQFLTFQAQDKTLDYNVGRQQTTFLDVALVLDLWRNGTTQNLTRNIMESIFRHETYPDNWYRNSPFAGLSVIGATNALVRTAHPIPAGHNDEYGNYINYPPVLPNNASFPCAATWDLASNHVPSALANQTGIFAQNVQTFLAIMFKPFQDVNNCTIQGVPAGELGI